MNLVLDLWCGIFGSFNVPRSREAEECLYNTSINSSVDSLTSNEISNPSRSKAELKVD